jgi:hypothetical protein
MNVAEFEAMAGAMTIPAKGRRRTPNQAADDAGVGGAAAPEPVAPAYKGNWKTGEYKPSMAMREAQARAHADQPSLITLSSAVRSDPHNWSDS